MLKWAIFLNIDTSSIRRGDIWLVNFDPTIGSEIKKQRPAVVISSDGVGKLPLKLVAPITAWQETFEDNLWHIKLEPNNTNHLTKPSAVDVLQLRGLDVARFIKKFGALGQEEMKAITEAVVLVVEHES
jgi:mRNA interferase MazF